MERGEGDATAEKRPTNEVEEDATRANETGEKRRLVLNPTSGGGEQTERARQLAEEHEFSVVETERARHAVELAERAAADGVDLLGVCGGDGTIHEVVEGLVAADALDSVTLCVVPAGTANMFASGLGIDDMTDGFAAAELGETRRLDVGFAGDEPFVLSAIAGLPAEASASATYDLKKRFGTLAFLIEGVQEARAFDPLRVEVRAEAGSEEIAWSGEALSLLVGNLRRFTKGGGQADAEDGLLEVAIVEQMPPTDAVAEAIEHRLLGQETPHVTEIAAARLDVVGLDGEPVTFSLDGEIRQFQEVRISVRPRALWVRVGADYEPNPGSKSPYSSLS